MYIEMFPFTYVYVYVNMYIYIIYLNIYIYLAFPYLVPPPAFGANNTSPSLNCDSSNHVHFGCARSHKRLSWRPLFRRSNFAGAPCPFLSYVDIVRQVWDMRGTLKSGTSVCVCGAGHRTLLHPRGGSGALCKVWVGMGGVFGSHFRGRRAAWWTWMPFWQGQSLVL